MAKTAKKAKTVNTANAAKDGELLGNTNTSSSVQKVPKKFQLETKNYFFTYHLLDGEDGEAIAKKVADWFATRSEKYIINFEFGKSGQRPHLQMSCNFDKKTKYTTIQNGTGLGERLHCEKQRSEKHAFAYCTKTEGGKAKLLCSVGYHIYTPKITSFYEEGRLISRQWLKDYSFARECPLIDWDDTKLHIEQILFAFKKDYKQICINNYKPNDATKLEFISFGVYCHYGKYRYITIEKVWLGNTWINHTDKSAIQEL